MRKLSGFPWQKWSLAAKLTLTITGMIVLVVVGLTLLSIRREQEVFRAELQQQAELLLVILSSVVTDPLYTLDADTLSDLLERLGLQALSTEQQILDSGRIYDAQGRILGDAYEPQLRFNLEPDPFGQQLVNSDTTVFVWGSEQLIAGRAVLVGSQRLGAISVGLSTVPLEAKIASLRNQGLSVALAAIVAGTLVALFLSRSITHPVQQLVEAAKRIASGDLELIVPVERQDELGDLAQAFYNMAVQLRGVIGNVEAWSQALEISAEISRQITSILDRDELLQYVVNRVQQEFNFYHTHLYLIEEDSDDLVMAEGSGEIGRQLKERGHRLPLGKGIVGMVANTNQPFLSNNVNEVANFIRNPLLPDTNSELAVPLRKGGRVLGVLDIQSDQFNRFTPEDMSLMQSIADQTAVALDNARLLAETKKALREVERLNRRLTREAWQEFAQEMTTAGYHFTGGARTKIAPTADAWLAPMQQAAAQKQLVTHLALANGNKAQAELAIPLLLRGEMIGVLGVKRDALPAESGAGEGWAQEEVAAVEAVANQVALALESARLSKEQEKTIVKLKDVDRLKSEFLTSMSHELRTPLNSIIGFADVLLQGIDGDLPDLALNDIQLIHNSGKHLLALINDILDLAKIEAGRMELVREPLELGEIFESVLASASSLIKNKPVQLVPELAPGLPPVFADKLRLSQVLLNLVSNAAKFTHTGSITVKAVLDSDNMMRISVKDTGIGIPPNKVNTIFERFRQVDAGTTRKYGGSGLGLAICKQLVEMHGGVINVTSQEGVGSEFYFTVPVAEVVPA
jgi:signal transduction histidine kinase